MDYNKIKDNMKLLTAGLVVTKNNQLLLAYSNNIKMHGIYPEEK
ncbi:hypothetical protein KL86DYS2_11069 [uncultured Dysgonomonas sp.]|uniref:Uncharacterized protein n=1 Tax=uncultured Dysgonomonas sp. TaxID=206096 RepID=A0A212JA39_9BACT|nr:hypothetical protein KL86DYS2_11069 [uncultured Dysgonomonas sp.]